MEGNRYFNRFLKYKWIVCLVMLFAFFPPLSISLLSRQVGGVWKLLDYGCKAAQILFATAGYVFWILDRKRKTSVWFIGLVLHLCMMVVTGLLNRNTSLSTLGGLYANVGFCLLCAGMYSHGKQDFIRGAILAFSAYTIWGVITVYLFPMGFFNAAKTYDAIYGLGAKNNAFPFFFACFFFWNIVILDTDRKYMKWIPLLIIPTVIAGYVCESTNTMICMVLLLVLTLFALGFSRVFEKISPVIVLVVFVAAIVLVYTGTESEVLAALLAKFNRTLTFSGRDRLWQQAIDWLSSNPILGVGSEVTFTLASKVTTAHAHSQWLDKLAKYGIIPMIILVYVVLYTFIRSKKYPNRKKANLLCGMLLIYMLHMSFDTYNYNFFTMFIIIANMIMDEEIVLSTESEVAETRKQGWLKRLQK